MVPLASDISGLIFVVSKAGAPFTKHPINIRLLSYKWSRHCKGIVGRDVVDLSVSTIGMRHRNRLLACILANR